MRRFTTLATAGLVTALLVGCSSTSAPDSSYDSGGGSAPSVETHSSTGDDASTEYMPSEDSADTGVDSEEYVITTGSVEVTTDDPVAAGAALGEKVTSLGGSVATSQQWTTYDDRPYVETTVRVPSAEFQNLMGWIPELGAIGSQSVNTENVTTQITDINAQIGALETSITRLTELMAEAETTADLLAAEDMLTQRQAQLDSLTSTLEYLSDQVSMSTLNVSFSTEPSHPGPSISWGESWDNFVRSVFWVLNALVFLVPWAAVLAVIVLAWRGIRRVRKSRAASRAVPTTHTSASGEPPRIT